MTDRLGDMIDQGQGKAPEFTAGEPIRPALGQGGDAEVPEGIVDATPDLVRSDSDRAKGDPHVVVDSACESDRALEHHRDGAGRRADDPTRGR